MRVAAVPVRGLVLSAGVLVAVGAATMPVLAQGQATTRVCRAPDAQLTAIPQLELSAAGLEGATLGRGTTIPSATDAELRFAFAPVAAARRFRLETIAGVTHRNPPVNLGLGGGAVYRIWKPSVEGLDFGLGLDVAADAEWLSSHDARLAFAGRLNLSLLRVELRIARDVDPHEWRLQAGLAVPLAAYTPHPPPRPHYTGRFINAQTEAEAALRNTYAKMVDTTVWCDKQENVLADVRRFLASNPGPFISLDDFHGALVRAGLGEFWTHLADGDPRFGALAEARKARQPRETDQAWASATCHAFIMAMVRVLENPM